MKGKIITSIALIAAVTLGGCAANNSGQEEIPEVSEEISDTQNNETEDNAAAGQTETEEGQEDIEAEQQEQPQTDVQITENEKQQEEQEQAEEQTATDAEEGKETAAQSVTVPDEEEAAASYASYIKVTGTGVNIRSGAGTSYTSLGAAEQNTLYANLDLSGGWYKTMYQNKTAYISATYCEEVEIEASENELVESVIAEGLKLLGVKYVYGAVRYHDGTGKLYSGFTITEFDCSSLMQYIFYMGAGVLLQVNTRTQIYQGEYVGKSDLQRGDLMFFTNDSRYNNTGVERVGHVALYLGDNYILHTSSDYAKIEQLTTKRWNYFLEARRMI